MLGQEWWGWADDEKWKERRGRDVRRTISHLQKDGSARNNSEGNEKITKKCEQGK